MSARIGGGVHTVAVTSGTAAMHLVLRYIGVGPGDLVAVQSATFIGSVYPILYLGAQPVFIDSEDVSGNIDPELVREYFAARARKRIGFQKYSLSFTYTASTPTSIRSRRCAKSTA